MLRKCIAVTLAVGSQALPLSSRESSLDPVGLLQPTSGYDHYPNLFCSGQDELGTGKGDHTMEHVTDLASCAATCTKIDICNSFEWTAATLKCTRSSTCTDVSEVKSNNGTDLFVKQDAAYHAYLGIVCLERHDANGTLQISDPDKYTGCNKGAGCSELEACADMCSAIPQCVSFEFKKETDRCELSSTCTHDSAHTNKGDKGAWNLYVKNIPSPPPTPYAPSPAPSSPLTQSQIACGPTCTDAVWNTMANNTWNGINTLDTCGNRIMYRAQTEFNNSVITACQAVGDKLSECADCFPTSGIAALSHTTYPAAAAARGAAALERYSQQDSQGPSRSARD